MEVNIIRITNGELVDLHKGLGLAIKELDKHTKGSDRMLSGRLEALLEKIEKQADR